MPAMVADDSLDGLFIDASSSDDGAGTAAPAATEDLYDMFAPAPKVAREAAPGSPEVAPEDGLGSLFDGTDAKSDAADLDDLFADDGSSQERDDVRVDPVGDHDLTAIFGATDSSEPAPQMPCPVPASRPEPVTEPVTEPETEPETEPVTEPVGQLADAAEPSTADPLSGSAAESAPDPGTVRAYTSTDGSHAGSDGSHAGASVADLGHLTGQVWFPDGGLSGHLTRLAQIAQAETWTEAGQEGTPVLSSYVRHTYRRLTEQGKILILRPASSKRSCAAFHTGLYTDFFEPIYAVLEENSNTGRQPWVFRGWATAGDARMQPFASTPPKIATYFSDAAEVVYDSELPLTFALDHIVDDNVERFPASLRESRHQRRLMLDAAIRDAEKSVATNWRLAVPHFYRNGGDGPGRVQLLMPLCLLTPGVPDLVLAVDRTPNGYRAHTVLTLSMARRNARLMARPTKDWSAVD